jgi:hypothetical protein
VGSGSKCWDGVAWGAESPKAVSHPRPAPGAAFECRGSLASVAAHKHVSHDAGGFEWPGTVVAVLASVMERDLSTSEDSPFFGGKDLDG